MVQVEKQKNIVGLLESLYPKQFLIDQAKAHPRRIEHCSWSRPVRIDLDIPNGTLTDPRHQRFAEQLSNSLVAQGHPAPGRPSADSDMIIGFFPLPEEPWWQNVLRLVLGKSKTIYDRVPEIDPLIGGLSRRYEGVTTKNQKNCLAVVCLEEDLASWRKRDMEKAARMIMVRGGSFGLVMINPEYYGLATLEGGLQVERFNEHTRNGLSPIDRLRDRLVTRACASEAGSYTGVPDVVERTQWIDSMEQIYLVEAFSQLGIWGYIDEPFDIRSVASLVRAILAERMESVGFSRQSESAGAIAAPSLIMPHQYQMGEYPGAIIATGSGRGRNKIDKRNMNPNTDLITVVIVPRAMDQIPQYNPFGLESFERYALGRKDAKIILPSIEFDEIAAAIFESGVVRVSRHPAKKGYMPNSSGDIVLPGIRAFIHGHFAVEEIRPDKIWGMNARKLAEYIQPNFDDYPYHAGCGRNITFAVAVDAIRRSCATQITDSDYLLAFFDSFNHGTNIVIPTKPLPGTNYIPKNPFEILLTLVHPQTGAVRLSEEIAQI